MVAQQCCRPSSYIDRTVCFMSGSSGTLYLCPGVSHPFSQCFSRFICTFLVRESLSEYKSLNSKSSRSKVELEEPAKDSERELGRNLKKTTFLSRYFSQLLPMFFQIPSNIYSQFPESSDIWILPSSMLLNLSSPFQFNFWVLPSK